MNRDTVSASPRSSRTHSSHSQRAVTETASLQRAPEALPITDPSLAERLSTHPAPVVRCKLPEHLDLLKQLGERITHLELVLDQPDPTQLDALINDIRASLPGCKALTTLKLDVNTPAEQVLQINWVSHAVLNSKLPVESLTLSINAGAKLKRSEGIKRLLASRPQLRLHVEGGPAAAIALKSMPAGVEGQPLVLSRIPSTDRAVIDDLALLGQTKRAIEIVLDDEDLDGFMDAVLQAGVASSLPLQVRTPQGRSICLQERLGHWQQLRLPKLLAQCVKDQQLDTAALFAACQQFDAGGAQLFAAACRVAIAEGWCEKPPEVPLAQAAYVRALDTERVGYLAVCVLPRDLAVLASCDKTRLTALRIELSEDISDLQALDRTRAAMAQMSALKTLSLHGVAPQDGLGWLVPIGERGQVEELHLDLQGNLRQFGDSEFSKFLVQKSLKRVSCQSVEAATYVLSTATNGDPRQTPLSVDLLLSAEAAQKRLLISPRPQPMPWLSLNIHVSEALDLEALKASWQSQLQLPDGQFRVGRLRISMLGQQLPASDPLLLAIDKKELERVMESQRIAQSEQRRQARVVDPTASEFSADDQRDLMGAFGTVIVNNFDWNHRLRGLNPGLLRDPLSLVAQKWLDDQSRMNLSASTTLLRSNSNYDEQAARLAVPWVQQMWADGFTDSDCRPALEALLPKEVGPAFADRVLQLAKVDRQ